ncbi:hypothetical protein H4582DRAFT_1250322 [Lactarius indigo]|nr:hypothetical protein H4582DRAFT_1250322 [Lactarius indigo]
MPGPTNRAPDGLLAHAVPHDNNAPLPAPLTSPDALSWSIFPPHVIESLADIPLDDFHSWTAHPTTTESLSFLASSPDPPTADAYVTSGGIIPRPTYATLTSAPPLFTTSPPAAVTLQHNADLMTPSDPPNHPSASYPILYNTLPTELHRSKIIPTIPSASTGPASASDLRAIVEDDGSLEHGPRNENDIHEPPSAIHAIYANTLVTPDPPQHSPSVADMDPTIASLSPREPNTEHTGDHPPQLLHCPYDIVYHPPVS